MSARFPAHMPSGRAGRTRCSGRAGGTLRRGLIDRGGRSIGSKVIGGRVTEMNVVSADSLEASLRTLRSADHRKLHDEVILACLI